MNNTKRQPKMTAEKLNALFAEEAATGQAPKELTEWRRQLVNAATKNDRAARTN